MPNWITKSAKVILWMVAPLAFIAQISPDDAIANVAKWLKYLGLEGIPDWLLTTKIDNYVFGS